MTVARPARRVRCEAAASGAGFAGKQLDGRRRRGKMAEETGFEPADPFRSLPLSRRAPWASQPLLQSDSSCASAAQLTFVQELRVDLPNPGDDLLHGHVEKARDLGGPP